MNKKKPTEKSLLNLEKRKSFSKDGVEFALECQKKSIQKRKENRLLKEIAMEKLHKKFSGKEFQDLSLDKLLNACVSDKAEAETVLKILTFLRDTSGQKPKEETPTVIMPVINIKGI